MSYTPIITAADLTDDLYQEKIDAITRTDSTKADTAIAKALEEVQSYLGRFDIIALFGDPVNNVAATVTSYMLKMLCINVAVWHLTRLANVGIDLTVIRTSYEDAIATLRRIQKVEQIPPNWPKLDIESIDADSKSGNPVAIKARPKRSNNF